MMFSTYFPGSQVFYLFGGPITKNDLWTWKATMIGHTRMVLQMGVRVGREYLEGNAENRGGV